MHALMSGILNGMINLLVFILGVSGLIIACGGGAFPGSIFNTSLYRQNFEVPVVFIGKTDPNRVYQKITYNKNNVKSGLGALEVEYTTSTKNSTGIKTTAYSFEKFYLIRFYARADSPVTLSVVLRDKEKEIQLTKNIEVTTEWQEYNIVPNDFLNQKEIARSNFYYRYDSYLEISVPPTEINRHGKFWIDELRIEKIY